MSAYASEKRGQPADRRRVHHIINIASQRMMGLTHRGPGPCQIAITLNFQFARVAQPRVQDMALLHTPTLTAERDKKATLLTMIPVGSAPAVLRGHRDQQPRLRRPSIHTDRQRDQLRARGKLQIVGH